MFPNHVPNPEDKTAIEFIQKQVLSTKADLGIIFDTDVDRAALIDSKGNAINRNRLIALIGAVVLKEHPGSYIVTDSVTSKGLKKFVEENKGIHHRYKRGYKNVIDEAIRLNNEGKESWLAIETSGHGALKENYFLDDGAYLMVKLLIEFANLRNEGKNLFDLIENLEEPFEEKEIRINIGDENFKAYGEKIMEELKAYAVKREGWTVESPNFEGIRVNCDKNNGDGWFLLRLSLHDPVLPLNIESDVSGGCEIIGKELMAFLSKFSLLFV
jgi:phosphomannomutase